MRYAWLKKSDFIVGFHTKKICERIDRAFEDFRNGKSSYILINVHHRSGKSDIVSRYLGAHFLGEFPDQEVMQVSYQANLAIGFSAFGRNVFKSEAFRELYPDVYLSEETNKKNEWLIVSSNGTPTGGQLYASGIASGLTGQSCACGILDDYIRGRSAAESEVQRNNVWESFTNDFMTRLAPIHIVIILATIWHWDDVSGRIEKAMQNDPDFPKFDIMRFPAKAENYQGEGEYPGKYLFLERFPESWYLTQYATLGIYSSAALLDCNPQLRSGGKLSLVGIVYEDFGPFPTQIKTARIWDLAHTAKQRSKDDPDYTSGTKLAFEKRSGDPVLHLWVFHVYRTREGAKKRDAEIEANVQSDGKFVTQAIEKTIESGDAFEYLSSAVKDVPWKQIPIHGDKGARATPLEVIFGGLLGIFVAFIYHLGFGL